MEHGAEGMENGKRIKLIKEEQNRTTAIHIECPGTEGLSEK